jgi:hypothetical protein
LVLLPKFLYFSAVSCEGKLTEASDGWRRAKGMRHECAFMPLPFRFELPQAAQHEARLKALKDQKERAAVPKF